MSCIGPNDNRNAYGVYGVIHHATLMVLAHYPFLVLTIQLWIGIWRADKAASLIPINFGIPVNLEMVARCENQLVFFGENLNLILNVTALSPWTKALMAPIVLLNVDLGKSGTLKWSFFWH